MDEQIKNKSQQAFKDHLSYLSAGKIREWVDLFSDDGVLEFPYGPSSFPDKVTGKEALFDYMQNFPKHFKVAFVNLYFHPTADPNLVIAEFESEGVAITTGKPYNQKYISVVKTTDDGKITSYVDFWNPMIAMESLGVKVDGAGFTEQFIGD